VVVGRCSRLGTIAAVAMNGAASRAIARSIVAASSGTCATTSRTGSTRFWKPRIASTISAITNMPAEIITPRGVARPPSDIRRDHNRFT